MAFLLAAANIRNNESFLREEAAFKAGAVRRLPRRRRTTAIGAYMPEAPG